MKNNDGSYAAMDGGYYANPPPPGYPPASAGYPSYAQPNGYGSYDGSQYGSSAPTTVILVEKAPQPETILVEQPLSYADMMDARVRLG